MIGALPNRIPKDIACNDDPRQRLIVALDVSSAASAERIVAAVGDRALTYKVGMQLYTAEGPRVVRDLVNPRHSKSAYQTVADNRPTVAQLP